MSMQSDPNRTAPPSSRIVSNLRKDEPGRFGPASSDGRNVLFPEGQGGEPVTIFVGGTSRSVVNGVAYALAEMIDLTPFWLDIRTTGSASDGPDPVSTGWIPPERLFVSEDGKGLETAADAADHALWSIVRSDEPASVLSHLTDFLSLPELIQEILGRAEPSGVPRACIAANTDRVAHLFPRTREGLQRFLSTLTGASFSIVAAHTGRSGHARFGFGIVFRVNAQSPETWMEGTLVCEQGLSTGPLAVGRINRLSDLPSVARVLQGMLPGKS